MLAYLNFNSKEKGLEHGEPQYDQPPQDPPKNEATLETLENCAPEPHTLHPDEDNGSGVNRLSMDDEGASQQIQRAQHGGQYTRQRELSSEWMEVSNTEGAVAEIAAKRLEEHGHVKWLLAPLSFDPPEPPRGLDSIKTITPIGEDWIGDESNPVSKIALSNRQQKLRNKPQDAPPGPTSSGASPGELKPKSWSSHIFALVALPAGCPYLISQAHRAQCPSLLSKHVGSEGALPGRTEVRPVFTFASQTFTTTVLS